MFLTFMISLQVFAHQSFDEELVESCIQSAKSNLSSTEISDSLKGECFTQLSILALRDQKLYVRVSSNFEVMAYKNIIYIVDSKNKPNLRFITGKSSGLNNILSIHYNKIENEIVVLNKDQSTKKEILTFNASRSGNISPIYKNNESFVENISKISLTHDAKILGIDLNGEKVLETQIHKDSRSPIFDRKPAAITSLQAQDYGIEQLKELYKTQSGTFLIDDLYGLSKVDKNKNITTILNNQELNKKLTKPFSFKFDSESKQLKVVDNAGNFYLIAE